MVTTKQITHVLNAFQQFGVLFQGVRIYPDGSVSLLSSEIELPSCGPEPGAWVNFAGLNDAPRLHS